MHEPPEKRENILGSRGRYGAKVYPIQKREGAPEMRSGINRIGDDLVYVMPGFIHEFGDPFHHMSLTRTIELDEDGGFIRGTGPSTLRFWLHELLDDCVFYPAQRWLSKWMGDNKIERFFREILGFFWGLNCGFPARDVALYTVWCFRGCPPLGAFKKRGERWVKTYPESGPSSPL